MRRAFGRSLILVASCFVAACGGGGGSSSSPLPAGPAVPVATPTPTAVKPSIGDVSTVVPFASPLVGNALAFDSDLGALLFDANGSVPWATSTLGQNTISLAYDSANKREIVGTGNGVWAATSSGQTELASGVWAVSVAVDPSGTIYVIDHDHLAKIMNGMAIPITAPGSIPYVLQPAMNTSSITYDTKDNSIYVANMGHNAVERITPSGAISTVAGSCTQHGTAVDGEGCDQPDSEGSGPQVGFGEINSIVYDSNNDVFYVGDAINNQIWSVTPSGTAKIIAGYGYPAVADGNGRFAFLWDPFALAFDAKTGSLYIRESHASTQSIVKYATAGEPQPNQQLPATMTWLPSRRALNAIRIAPDGTPWLTTGSGPGIADFYNGSFYEAQLPASGGVLAVDSQGGAWTSTDTTFPGTSALALAKVTATGQAATYQLPTNLSNTIESATVGGDGRVWFTSDIFGQGGFIASINPSTLAFTTQFAFPSAFNDPSPKSLILAPDGNYWFLLGQTVIERLTPGGQLLAPISLPSDGAYLLVPDPKAGLVWFSDGQFSAGFVTMSGMVTALPAFSCGPGCATWPGDIAPVGDGSAWFIEENTNTIAHVSASGTASRYVMPLAVPGYRGLRLASDGTLWIATYRGALIHFNPAAYDATRLPHLLTSQLRPAVRRAPDGRPL